ncbi:hypothetical protein [Streptomyces sp. NPDC096033]|uniref:hypothetical protein n=1 Tax=Streptomyces sp. NPDC096033 TaxID=3366071 RepID=UPI003818214F
MDLNLPPAKAAEGAAEAVRTLNHLTLKPAAFEYAGDASDTIQALLALVSRLPQALTQTVAAVERHHRQGAIRMEDGSDPTDAFLRVEENLTAAEVGITDEVIPFLRKAASVLARMGAPYDPADDPDRDK